MSNTRSSDMLIAFAVGGLVGAATALMLAPAAGSETRRRLREAGGQAAGRVRGAWDHAREAAAEHAHRIGQALEEGKSAYKRDAAERRWIAQAQAGEVRPDEPGAT